MALIYPPKLHQTQSETIFFIGSAEDSCSINGEKIDLVYEGNFCPVLALELGENIFNLEIDDEQLEVLVTREKQEQKPSEHVYEKYNGVEPKTKFSRICLDPGHGGAALGTVSPKGIAEKDLNLSLCLAIQEELEKNGFEVFLTRTEDCDLSLEQRIQFSKENACDLFLSIHHNAIPDHLNPLEHHGLSAHYYYEHSYELAKNISAELSSNLDLKNNSAIRQNLYVTRENKHSQALLIEAGYLIHPEESERISKSEFQAEFAIALAKILKNL